MASIRIVHTRVQGTLVEGTAKGDGSNVPLKTAGFRWSGQLGAWYIRGSRDRVADRARIDHAAALLNGAGFTVEVEVDDVEHRSVADVEEQKYARVADRADALANKAARAAVRSEELGRRAEAIAERRPFGQPILVGHHSERAHRRDLDRQHRLDHASVQEYRRANLLDQQAQAAKQYEANRTHVPTTLRRIAKLEAEIRQLGRYQDSARRAGNQAAVDRYQVEVEAVAAQVAHWRDVIAAAEAAGVKVWGPADFTVGGFALHRGTWYEVVRVNAKSITIPATRWAARDGVVTKANADLSWTDRIGYADLTGSASRDELASMLDRPINQTG